MMTHSKYIKEADDDDDDDDDQQSVDSDNIEERVILKAMTILPRIRLKHSYHSYQKVSQRLKFSSSCCFFFSLDHHHRGYILHFLLLRASTFFGHPSSSSCKFHHCQWWIERLVPPNKKVSSSFFVKLFFFFKIGYNIIFRSFLSSTQCNFLLCIFSFLSTIDHN